MSLHLLKSSSEMKLKDFVRREGKEEDTTLYIYSVCFFFLFLFLSHLLAKQ